MQTHFKVLMLPAILLSCLMMLAGCASKIEVDSTMNMPSKSGLSLGSIGISRFDGDRYGITGNAVLVKSNRTHS
ncbi:MAG: hypothetical protein ACJAYN_001296 [Bermanella sp.]|jgi:hypothetical protein